MIQDLWGWENRMHTVQGRPGEPLLFLDQGIPSHWSRDPVYEVIHKYLCH